MGMLGWESRICTKHEGSDRDEAVGVYPLIELEVIDGAFSSAKEAQLNSYEQLSSYEHERWLGGQIEVMKSWPQSTPVEHPSMNLDC